MIQEILEEFQTLNIEAKGIENPEKDYSKSSIDILAKQNTILKILELVVIEQYLIREELSKFSKKVIRPEKLKEEKTEKPQLSKKRKDYGGDGPLSAGYKSSGRSN